MRYAVFVLVWYIQAQCAALYLHGWRRVGTALSQPAVQYSADAVSNRETLNQLKRDIEMKLIAEKVSGLKRHLEMGETESDENEESWDLKKRPSVSEKKEINRFLTRLLRFTQLNTFDGGNASNQKRSTYEIPIKNLPPVVAKPIGDGLQTQNNLEDDTESLKVEGQFQAPKRSSDDSIRLTLAQLKGLIGRIKQDADPLRSMLEHVAMEMKEETGNKLLDDDDENYADWFMDDQRIHGGQVKKEDVNVRAKDGRYLRYGRGSVFMGDDLGWASSQDGDQDKMDVLNKGIYKA